ncbi:hypothetical protein D018_1351A, partial [Vibrio parahaemolyticus VP2007-007]
MANITTVLRHFHHGSQG